MKEFKSFKTFKPFKSTEVWRKELLRKIATECR
jgi:hypothetical protein